MTKTIEVTMPDGSVWQFPANLVAAPRAAYYAERDTGTTSGPEFDRAFRRELDIDDDKLIDWAQNNMDWKDVAHLAQAVKRPTQLEYHRAWPNAPMEVVDSHDPVW